MASIITGHDGQCSEKFPCRKCRARAYLNSTVSPEIRGEIRRILDGTETIGIETEIRSLGLSVTVRTALHAHDILTVGDMVAYTRPQLLNFPNLGYKAVRAIEEMLANSKLSLKKVG